MVFHRKKKKVLLLCQFWQHLHLKACKMFLLKTLSQYYPSSYRNASIYSFSKSSYEQSEDCQIFCYKTFMKHLKIWLNAVLSTDPHKGQRLCSKISFLTSYSFLPVLLVASRSDIFSSLSVSLSLCKPSVGLLLQQKGLGTDVKNAYSSLVI